MGVKFDMNNAVHQFVLQRLIVRHSETDNTLMHLFNHDEEAAFIIIRKSLEEQLSGELRTKRVKFKFIDGIEEWFTFFIYELFWRYGPHLRQANFIDATNIILSAREHVDGASDSDITNLMIDFAQAYQELKLKEFQEGKTLVHKEKIKLFELHK